MFTLNYLKSCKLRMVTVKIPICVLLNIYLHFLFIKQNINVIFYYLRKKSKNQFSNEYRYTTANCVFRNHILAAHARYYNMADDANLSTKEHLAHGVDVSRLERSSTHNINGYCIHARYSLASRRWSIHISKLFWMFLLGVGCCCTKKKVDTHI